MKSACLKRTFFFTLLVFSFFGIDAAAQSGAFPGPDPQNDSLSVKVALIGPGDELYFWWGHIGLVIEDKTSGQARFYDWGVFSFENENFFLNFAFGRLYYCCAVSRADANYSVYQRTNRDITLYTLNLPPEKKEALLRFAENNVLPENRDYEYHHFRDNCATRIRDILDIALDGQFGAAFAGAPGRYTLRQHVSRHTWFNPLVDWFFSFLMGQDIDRPVTVWDEMFLPSEVAARIKDFQYTGPDGKLRPLVTSVETVNTARGRPAVLDVPRLRWPGKLIASFLFSLALVLFFLFFGKRKGFKIFIGLTQSLLGLFFGAAGSLLFFMSFFTNHDYTYHNSNILFINPLLFAALPLGLIFAFTGNAKKRFIAARLLRLLWTCVILGGLLTMAMKLSAAFYQQNQVSQALVIPLALALVFIMAGFGRFALIGKKTSGAAGKNSP